ncbi:hypothetical protein CKO20_13745 [Rhodocyclus tenuis]|nr:hypothetical protein [Rhodocyclus tenuis]
MLLMIGYLTTPTSSTGISLSEFWAWVRYLGAISNEANMSLTHSFADLDAHQKTILSDDFGMGVPVLWLCDKLALKSIVDGRYFMQKFAASVGALQRRTAKRGPNKTPDFVAQDVNGSWHVIECKGTQSGVEYCAQQLGTKGPPPTGGVAQKCSIQFPNGHTGQRLACGLSIGIEGNTGSVLRVVDPEPDEPVVIEADKLQFAEDAVTRGVMSRVLRMSGFEVAAEAIASPLGRSPDARHFKTRRQELDRKAMVLERDGRARRELGDSERQKLLFDKGFIGRELTFELPRSILVNDDSVSHVILRQGVNRDAIHELEMNPTADEFIEQTQSPWTELIGRNLIKSDGPVATMTVGDIFRSELTLESRR